MNLMNSTHRSNLNQKGIALLTVLVSILIISLLTIEFQYSVATERKLAYNDLNQLQAHYLAKSAARFSLLRLVLYFKAVKNFASTDPSGTGITKFLPLIWNLPIPPFPPAKTTVKKLEKADQDAAEKQLAETKVSEGQFFSTITSESSKINLNSLILTASGNSIGTPNFSCNESTPPDSITKHVFRLLCQVVDDIFKKSDNPQDEYGTSRPDDVVLDIMDWVNPANITLSAGNKDSFYEQQKPPYKAKKGRFFTLEELKLVRSINDNLYKQLKPHITVYSYEGKINLNDATNSVLKAIYPEFTEDDLKKIQDKKNEQGGWAKEGDFVSFVTAILGRRSFASRYPNPAEYPFTVDNQSFTIEAVGTIPKNKYAIQKKIRLAVATTSSANKIYKDALSSADCTTKHSDAFWRPIAGGGLCQRRPTSKEECIAIAGSTYIETTTPPTCNVSIDGGGVTPVKVLTGSGTNAKPDNLKVLYWMES
jgi:type II secretory pathway component PulK